MKYEHFAATKVIDVPNEEHFAVLINRSRREDDGYGDWTNHDYVEYHVMTSEEVLKDWLLYSSHGLVYKVVKTFPATVETKISIDLGPPPMPKK